MRRRRAVAAGGLALAIGTHLAVGAARAETPNQDDGPVRVEGRSSENGATLLGPDPGWYRSEAPGAGETLHYQVERINPDTHVTVGLWTRPESSMNDAHVEVALLTTSGVTCDTGGTWSTEADHPRLLLDASVTDAAGGENSADARECQRADTFVLEVWQDSTSNDELAGTEMDLTVHEEPRAENAENLPAPPSEPREWEVLSSSDRADVEGATAPLRAKPLRPGSYATTISPGEQLFFRVDLDWGEALQGHARVPLPPDEVADAIRSSGYLYLQGQLLGPTSGNPRVWNDVEEDTNRATLAVDSASELRVWTNQVRYRNRAAEDPPSARKTSAPGPYYLVLTLSDAPADFDLPVELELDVRGTPDQPPEYADDAELLGPGWGTREIGGDEPAGAWLLGGGIALVALGGGTLLGVPRRPRSTGA